MTKDQIKKECKTRKNGLGFWEVYFVCKDGYCYSAQCHSEANTRKEAQKLTDLIVRQVMNGGHQD